MVLALDKVCVGWVAEGQQSFLVGELESGGGGSSQAQLETSQPGPGAVCRVPGKLQEQQSPSEYQGGPGSPGSCVLHRVWDRWVSCRMPGTEQPSGRPACLRVSHLHDSKVGGHLELNLLP